MIKRILCELFGHRWKDLESKNFKKWKMCDRCMEEEYVLHGECECPDDFKSYIGNVCRYCKKEYGKVFVQTADNLPLYATPQHSYNLPTYFPTTDDK